MGFLSNVTNTLSAVATQITVADFGVGELPPAHVP